MLDFFLVTGSSYLMYRWGIRQMVRSRIVKSRISDRTAYLLFMATGCTLSLYLSFVFVFPFLANWSVYQQSIIPTVVGIWIGEFFYSRNLAITLRMLKQIRGKDGQANE